MAWLHAISRSARYEGSFTREHYALAINRSQAVENADSLLPVALCLAVAYFFAAVPGVDFAVTLVALPSTTVV